MSEKKILEVVDDMRKRNFASKPVVILTNNT